MKSGQQIATPSCKKGSAKNSENKLRTNEKLLLQQYEWLVGPGKNWILENALNVLLRFVPSTPSLDIAFIWMAEAFRESKFRQKVGVNFKTETYSCCIRTTRNFL